MVLVLVNFCPIRNRAALCIMDETLDVQLPPWFAISNSTLKSNSLKKKLTQNGCGHVYVPYATRLPVSLWRRTVKMTANTKM